MLGPCRICRHEIRSGFGFSPKPFTPTLWCCSAQCVALIETLTEEQMTENEAEAQEIAGRVGGMYLDSIHKSDLGELTASEWSTFLTRMFEAYSLTLFELAGGNKPPF